MFALYCDERKLNPMQAVHTSPSDFLEWIKDRPGLNEQREQVCEDADASVDTWVRLLTLTDDPLGANQLAGIWPQVILHFRGTPRHELESIHTVVLLKWKDGCVVPLSSFVPRELASTGAAFTDGVVCTMIQVSAHNLMQVAQQYGMDALHDTQSLQADEEAFDILMGTFLQIIPQLKPEFHERLKNVMRTLQSMFRPPIPPPVRQMIAERQRRLRAAEPKPPGPVEGGWE